MFIVGSVHTRDNDLGCSVAGVRNRPRGVVKKGLWYAHSGRRSNSGCQHTSRNI